MSLKGFHLVFVTVSTLLCIFLALWGFLLAGDQSGMTLALGTVGAVGSLLMPAYGIYFWRKITRIHI